MASYYMRYLVMEQMVKRIEKVGGKTGHAIFSHDGVVRVAVDYRDAAENWLDAQGREDLANAWLQEWHDGVVDRSPSFSGGEPRIMIAGETAAGVKWEVDFGRGVCERKQVGTRVVNRPDPELLALVPRVDIEEPVYEYLCPDPLASL